MDRMNTHASDWTPEQRRRRHLEQLAMAVLQRRKHLGFKSRQALADSAGLGKRTIDSVETAEKHVRTDSLYKLDRVLGWEVGTCEQLLTGDPLREQMGEIAKLVHYDGEVQPGKDEPRPGADESQPEVDAEAIAALMLSVYHDGGYRALRRIHSRYARSLPEDAMTAVEDSFAQQSSRNQHDAS